MSVVDKYRRLAAHVLDDSTVDELLDLLTQLERCEDVRALTDLMRGP
jgi:hypothetical protein